jgi:hypothetical protein
LVIVFTNSSIKDVNRLNRRYFKTKELNMRTIVFVFLCLSACVTKPLTVEEQGVRILRKSDAPPECKDLGKVVAPGMASISEEGRESDLKRATYKVGGDTVTMDRRDENNTIFGTAFKCNKPLP